MHGRNPGYISGDYWQNCDVCGFNYRRSQMRQRWDGLWVCDKDWEPQHPQDLVVGIPDHQAVPVARPDHVDFTNSTTLTADAAAGATFVSVASISGISQYFSVGVALDDTTIHWDQVTNDPTGGLSLTLFRGLFGPATSGNTVYVRGDAFRTTEPTSGDL